MLSRAKISKIEVSLKSFKKGERPNDETAEDSKTAHRKKAAFKRKYQESYLNYWLVAKVIHILQALCITCGDCLFNEAMTPSEVLCHTETKHPALKDKPLGFFKRKKCEHKEQQQFIEGQHFTKCVCTESIILSG